MAKYKVGDKVRIVSERPASPRFVDSMVQYLGKTLTVSKVEEEPLGAIYRFKEATYPASVSSIMEIMKIFLPKANGMWVFCEDWIAGLAEQKKPADENLSVTIRFCGRMTVAELNKNGRVVKVENARCNPKDTYSRAEGARVAVERLFEKKRKEDTTKESKPKIDGKFVIISDKSPDCRHHFRIGSVVTTLEHIRTGENLYVADDGLVQIVRDCDVAPYREKTK